MGLATLLALVGLVLGAAPALAARGHVFDAGLTLGTPCTEVVCLPGELKEPSAVAVNETSADVYVLDAGNKRIERFDGTTGALLGEFEGTATKAGSFEEALGIAVDNACALHEPPLSGSACAAFDESSGDVYVADHGAGVIDKFSATGTLLGEIKETSSGPFVEPPLTVAVGTTGSLYTYFEGHSFDVFSNAEPNAFTRTAGISVTGFGVPGLAVDSGGDLYARLLFTGVRIIKSDPTGHVLKEEVDSETSSAVGVDQRTDVAFIDNLTSVGAFSAAGVEEERLGKEGGAEHLIEGAGIGVNATTDFIYVADSAAGHVIAFEPELPGPPSVQAGSTFVSEVSAEAATLHAEVNPRSEGLEAPTTYSFQYGPCASPTSCTSSPFGLTSGSGSLPADFQTHPVAIALTGLVPGTTYHYRVAAENSHDAGAPTLGEEGTFTTQSALPFAPPDSRQWQLVSPAEKLGARIEPISEIGVVEAAAQGNALTYLTSTPTEIEPQGYTNHFQILSNRGSEGWSTRDIGIPHATTAGSGGASSPEYEFFSRDLSQAVVQPYGTFDPLLSAEASESTAFLRSLGPSCGTGCYRPLVSGAPGFANVPPGTKFGESPLCAPTPVGTGSPSVVCGPRFLGASEDLGHVVLRSKAALVEAGGEGQIYEWSAGRLRQISVLPGSGLPAAPDAALGRGDFSAQGAISADGSRVFWEDEGKLFLTTASGSSVQLDKAESNCPGCEEGGGAFQFADRDGSRVFFTDILHLTEDSGAEPGGIDPKADLYECRIVEATLGTTTCELTDLTPETGGESAGVLGAPLGVSADGSSVFFVAEGELATNAVDNGGGPETAQAGRPNLYLDREGTITYLATLATDDEHDWNEHPSEQPTRVSPNGEWLALMSQRSLTGYDNRDASAGEPVAEVYLYDAAGGRLSCASCNPSGARPHGVEYRRLEPPSGGLVGGPRGIWGAEDLVAANVPGWTASGSGTAEKSGYQDRYLSDSGRLFFNANDGLVPADSNGTEDVYEYEPAGVGGCGSMSPGFNHLSGACVELISSGTSGEESAFLDASENGDDVFFLTASRLNGQDTDSALDVYDAHSCESGEGCLSEPVAPAEPCRGENCRTAAAAPVEAAPSTQSFVGPANPRAVRKPKCPKGKTKKGSKCVKKHKQKQHAKHHHKKPPKKRRTDTDRRSGR